jgi:hypothetical protein
METTQPSRVGKKCQAMGVASERTEHIHIHIHTHTHT